jgi:transposase
MSRRCSSDGKSSKKVEQRQAEIEAGQLVVVMADECHLLAGDASGYGWGRKSERLTVTVANPKERQSYFGALDAISGEVVLLEAKYANSGAAVSFLETLQKHYTGKQLWVIWDNASYHKSETVRQYLQKVNGQLPEKDWLLTLLHFAPNAPEQNPIEAVWLQGKTQVRKQAGLNCFQKVKQFFVDVISAYTYSFDKFKWYGL